MTDQQLESIIDRLNAGDRGCAFLRPLLNNVDYGKVWLHDPDGGKRTAHGYGCFAIRNESGVYIGAVLEMGEEKDLHAFVKPKHRRKGVMTAALCEVVLPFLKSEGRSEHTVSLLSIEGIRLAEKLEFDCDPKFHTARIDLTRFPSVDFTAWEPTPIDDQRLLAIHRAMSTVSQVLDQTADEIEVAHTVESPLVPVIREHAEKVADLRIRLKDEIYDLGQRVKEHTDECSLRDSGDIEGVLF
jgi:GNAT superfamily N-acetyltransferase